MTNFDHLPLIRKWDLAYNAYDLQSFLTEANFLLSQGYCLLSRGRFNTPFEDNITIGVATDYSTYNYEYRTIGNWQYKADAKTSWGKFSSLSNSKLFYLYVCLEKPENIPPEIYERIYIGDRIYPGTMKFYPDRVILVNNETKESIEIDAIVKPNDQGSWYKYFRLHDTGTQIIPVYFENYISKKDDNVVRISNQSVSIPCVGALVDPVDHLLVAAYFPETVIGNTKAIMASLTNSTRSKDWISITEGSGSEAKSGFVYSAKKGYHRRSSTMSTQGINARAITIFHAGTVHVWESSHFYMLDHPEFKEGIECQLVSRLNLVQPIGLLRSWGPALLKYGLRIGAIKELLKYGKFIDGYRVDVRAATWEPVVKYLLAEKEIKIEEVGWQD
jgi:hypothetical protein